MTQGLSLAVLDQNPDRQLAAVGECHRVFIDREQGSRERLAHRAQLGELIQFVRVGDHVVVAYVDRLARSVIELNKITRRLAAKGASVEFLQERLDFRAGATEDPFAQFQMNLRGSFAQFEREMIRRRQAEGIAAAKVRGVYKGRARTLDGDAIQAVRERAARGVPKAHIAREPGISRSTLCRYLGAKVCPVRSSHLTGMRGMRGQAAVTERDPSP